MAEVINKLVPSMEQVRLVSSGTEATMSAIRVARGFTGRNKIVKFEGCYHGHSDALLVKAGSGLLTFSDACSKGVPSSAGVPAEVVADTLTLEYNNTQSLKDLFSQIGEMCIRDSHNAQKQQYGLLSLSQRAVENAVLPNIFCIDTAKSPTENGLSPILIKALRERLARKEQSLLFINRRGYAPVLHCNACQWVAPCMRCSARMVVHLSQKRLKCHHCGHELSLIHI